MLLFDDCTDHITNMIRVGTTVMGIDVHKFDILTDFGYIDDEDNALGYVDHNPSEHFFGISLSDKVEAIAFMPEIIAHELVHIQQYQSGRLKDIRPGEFEWEGERIIFHSKLNPQEYWSLPWEVEAYSKQDFWATKIRNRI